MGSVGNQNPWAPYNNYKDCSQGVCSIYCPQFCYFVFPPPPPENDSAAPFSPLIIAIIGVLATAFLLVSYYTIVTRYCKTRRNQTTSLEIEQNRGQFRADSASGLDEALINTIAVCKYRKGEGLIEGSECAVCLSEFQENEPLRLLPKCSHAFHLPCIDTWLKSHSNCPLCRAHVVALAHPQSSPPHRVVSDQDQVPNELVLVVDDQEIVSLISDDDADANDENGEDIKETMSEKNVRSDQEGNISQFRRSTSLDTFQFQRQLLISDIMKFEETESKSSGYMNNRSKDLQIKRSFSSGGCIFGVSDKGKNTILPR